MKYRLWITGCFLFVALLIWGGLSGSSPGLMAQSVEQTTARTLESYDEGEWSELFAGEEQEDSAQQEEKGQEEDQG
jgi:hypothetical protein